MFITLVFVLIPALIAGTVAWTLTRGRQRPGTVASAVIGFVIAAAGGMLAWFYGLRSILQLIGAVVPSVIFLVWLRRISKAENGKTATRASQRPDHQPRVASAPFDAPRSPARTGPDRIGGSTDTQAAPSKSGIFISYRREDKRDFARVLYERLARHIDEQQIFMDVDSIELGMDFVEAINRRLAQCNLMLVVIGNRWLDSVDSSGARRLDNPDDFVRLEVETALARSDVRVIPILVDGAKAPTSTDLPDTLRPLARRNALIMTHENFGADFGRLYDVVQKVVPS